MTKNNVEKDCTIPDEIPDDDFEKLFDELEREHHQFNAELIKADEAIDLCLAMMDILNTFHENMSSLSLSFATLESKPEEPTNFLTGIICSGIISAYEGCIHDILDAILSNNSLLESAISRWPSLTTADRGYLKIKGQLNQESIRNKLRTKTLHDPNQISRIVKSLFDMDIPKLPDALCQALLRTRNAYTHNNGIINGSKDILTPKSVIKVYNLIFNLITRFSDAIQERIDTFD
ncbi:hypothetical protein RYH74_08325 [Pseudomonas sp. LSJ-87]|uniref:HEPN domain-containing protein n=1 Tax=Pseudomonas sp. LSJ-87 TaxID=3079932 RepID=UPI002941500D|nr:HEPN domain-containing protein [Pseudomonas sp. LSJ-87]MDV5097293.1 hypothetical protein [Pseudomonas sp. LSJ-87]